MEVEKIVKMLRSPIEADREIAILLLYNDIIPIEGELKLIFWRELSQELFSGYFRIDFTGVDFRDEAYEDSWRKNLKIIRK